MGVDRGVSALGGRWRGPRSSPTAAGAFDLASDTLARQEVGTAATAELSARETLTALLVSAASGDRVGQAAALEEAADLATAVDGDRCERKPSGGSAPTERGGLAPAGVRGAR